MTNITASPTTAGTRRMGPKNCTSGCLCRRNNKSSFAAGGLAVWNATPQAANNERDQSNVKEQDESTEFLQSECRRRGGAFLDGGQRPPGLWSQRTPRHRLHRHRWSLPGPYRCHSADAEREQECRSCRCLRRVG